jgi:two-component system, NarL family, nitrate/nitrite response regulator NarL
MGQGVRLVLATGHPVFAEGLGMILDAEADFTVCGVAHDGCRVVELAAAHRPCVLLLDAHLPGGDPDRTPAAIKAASPATKVLLLAAGTRGEATAADADGMVAPGASSRQLADAIRRVVDGKSAVMAAVRPRRRPREPGVELLRAWALSDRELEVLGLLAAGWSNLRIAQEWHVSVATVRTHVQNLLVKLGVHSKLEAVAFAFRHGMTAGGSAPQDRHSA